MLRPSFVQTDLQPEVVDASEVGSTHPSEPFVSRARALNLLGENVNNSAISIKFRTDFYHVTLDVPRTFKVNRSKGCLNCLKRLSQRDNISTSKNFIIQARISCRR